LIWQAVNLFSAIEHTHSFLLILFMLSLVYSLPISISFIHLHCLFSFNTILWKQLDILLVGMSSTTSLHCTSITSSLRTEFTLFFYVLNCNEHNWVFFVSSFIYC
jgi:hypothetical protein